MMNDTQPALHIRRKNLIISSDEENLGLLLSTSLSSQQQQQRPTTTTTVIKRTNNSGSTGGSSSISSSNKQRLTLKQKLFEVQISYVVISIFIFIGFIFTYILLHHQHRKVIVHVILRNPWAHGRAALRMAVTRQRHTYAGFHHHFYNGNPKFVTIVMPSVVRTNERKQRLYAIHDTWGPYARAIYVLHNINEFDKASHLTHTIDKYPYDKYSFPQNLLLPDHIDVNQGIARLYYTIQMIHERVNPDFAFFVNDHTYVIPEHVCHYLEDGEEKMDPNMNLYAGHALKNDQSTIFNSGAAGYILSRETMKKIIQQYNAKDEHCYIDPSSSPPSSSSSSSITKTITKTNQSSNSNKKWLENNPGLVIVDCLRSMGITAIDTRQGNKYHRFHAFPLVRMVSGDLDAWYINKHQFDTIIPSNLRNGFDTSYSTLLVGTDCCAKDSISFHYVEAKECRALYKIQKTLLDHPQISDVELQSMMEQNWPTDTREIGGYSRTLPSSTNTIEWKKLLITIRNISTKDTQTDC